MASLPKYKQFLSEYVRQQMAVLGPNLAVDTANRIEGLEFDRKGSVVNISTDLIGLTSTLVAEFSKLSPKTTSYLTHLLFTRYPEIAEEFPDTLTNTNFLCALIKPKA